MNENSVFKNASASQRSKTARSSALMLMIDRLSEASDIAGENSVKLNLGKGMQSLITLR